MRRTENEKRKTCLGEDRAEPQGSLRGYDFLEIEDDSFVEVHIEYGTFEDVISPTNLNRAYERVRLNKGASGVDGMTVEGLLEYLRSNGEHLRKRLREGKYKPNPVRRVDIPKDNGGNRPLGIPTVVDRMVQQSISQVLTSIYEPTFSETSYGFRPNRSAHDAVKKAQEYINDGYRYVVDLDLASFFDTVNHSRLVQRLSDKVKDGRIISLIHKYLNAGVMVNGVKESTESGVPQGGPLSPILANIVLGELDKELEHRGLRFVRYADDCMIFAKSHRAAERIRGSITRFIEETLRLRVNEEKTSVRKVFSHVLNFLGFSFHSRQGECRIGISRKSKRKLKDNLRSLTSRSKTGGYHSLKVRLTRYVNGWVHYFKIAEMRSWLTDIDSWLRRRVRMCIWKLWKNPKTRVKNLLRCGLDIRSAKTHGYASVKYWRAVATPGVHIALSNERLLQQGYPSLLHRYNSVCIAK